VQLRNPAEVPQRQRVRIGPALAGIAAVAAVAVGVTVVVPQLISHEGPAATPAPTTPSVSTSPRSSSASPTPASTTHPIGTADGVHPLWPLRLSDGPTKHFADLSEGGHVDLPLPYTLDPQMIPELVDAPTLVTTAGSVQFDASKFKTVRLLGQRAQGVFVVLNGVGYDGIDGFHDASVVLVRPDNSRRELYSAAELTGVHVSPDGAMVAVSTPDSVEIVDVTSGKVTHRLSGKRLALAWASNERLLFGPEAGPFDREWRAPWTGAGQPTTSTVVLPQPIEGGNVVFTERGLCVQRLNADEVVTAANCSGARSAGPISPGGRYVPLEWTKADGTVARGVLDVAQGVLRPWPLANVRQFPSWLGPDDVVLTEEIEDPYVAAHCNLTTGVCGIVTDQISSGLWRGADWLSD
jgi:hypothetical protein